MHPVKRNAESEPRDLRAAFTLVELLVVITIIGILIALLLPAVQSAREAARRLQCANNFKQVGLAMHNYHSAMGVFPTGTLHAGSGRCIWTYKYWGYSWAVFILPYLEQTAVYDHFSFNVEYNIPPSSDLEAGGASIGVYLCPSDPQRDPLVNATGSINRPGRDTREDLGRTNMVGVADSKDWTCDGYWVTEHGDGVLYNYSATRIGDILDGSSNTLAVGEMTGRRTGDFEAHNYVTYVLCDTSTGINGSYTIPGGGMWQWYGGGFSSYHPGGCHFLMADGSVQFLSENINQIVLSGLTTRDGRELVSVGQ